MNLLSRALRALLPAEPMPAERINRDLAIAGLDARDRIRDLEAALTEARRQRAVPPQAYINAEQLNMQREHFEALERHADKQVASAREAAECAVKWLKKWRRLAHAKDVECTALRADLAKAQALAASRVGVRLPPGLLERMVEHAKPLRIYKLRGDYYAVEHESHRTAKAPTPQAALDALAAKL